jgi:hypothetical protein
MTDAVGTSLNAVIYLMMAVIVFKGATDVALNMLLFLSLLHILLAFKLRN